MCTESEWDDEQITNGEREKQDLLYLEFVTCPGSEERVQYVNAAQSILCG